MARPRAAFGGKKQVPRDLKDAPANTPIERALERRMDPGFEGIRKETLERAGAIAPEPVDIDKLLEQAGAEDVPERQGGARGAIARALRGFAAGAQATPAGAYADAPLAGLVGGLTGVGKLSERRRAEGLQQRIKSPRAQLRQKIMEAQAGEAVKEPYRKAKTLRGIEAGIGTRRAITAGGLARMREIGRLKPEGVSPTVWKLARESAVRALEQREIDEFSPGFIEALLRETQRQVLRLGAAGVKGAAGAAAPAGGQEAERARGRRNLGLQP